MLYGGKAKRYTIARVRSLGEGQSFATGRISVPLVLSAETPNIPGYNFLDNEKHKERIHDADNCDCSGSQLPGSG